MSTSKDEFLAQREWEQTQEQEHEPYYENMNQEIEQEDDPEETQFHTVHFKPNEVILTPDAILMLSKESAETFHNKMKQMIYDTGYGLFEYLESIQFFSKLKEVIHGSENNPGDPEFISYVRDEIAKQGEKGKLLTKRGVKFENAEVGTRYDFSSDPVWNELKEEERKIAEKRKDREGILKTIKNPIQELVGDTVIDVHPADKTSKSSFKITLAK